MSKRIRGAVVAAVILCWAVSSAQASSLIPDLNPLRPAATLLPGGDFDGDGRRDSLYFSAEPGSDRIAVHARLNTISGPRDIRVTSLDISAAAPGVRVVPAGAYAADCGNVVRDCGPAITAAHDSLILGMDSGTSVLLHWQGDHFEADFVHNDDAGMDRVLSALYAANP